MKTKILFFMGGVGGRVFVVDFFICFNQHVSKGVSVSV